MRCAALLILLPLTAEAAEAAAGVCVTNGTQERAFFVAAANGVPQAARWLDPSDSLCSGPGRGTGGVVRVFTSEGALEGCSRLVSEGRTETLLAYQDFDRCRWSSHGR